jgi:hypothetical protein
MDATRTGRVASAVSVAAPSRRRYASSVGHQNRYHDGQYPGGGSPLSAGAEARPHQSLVQFGSGACVSLAPDSRLQLLGPSSSRSHVDLFRQGRMLSENVYASLSLPRSDVKESSIDQDQMLPVALLDPHRMHCQRDQHRGMSGKDADVPIHSFGHNHLGVSRPYFPLGGNNVHL